MKDKKLIIITAFLAVLICLIITVLLFIAVTPRFLVILSFTIGVVTGICITSLIYYLVNSIKNKRLDNDSV
jgi:cytosine/uracil/thiamine/allantoin permease